MPSKFSKFGLTLIGLALILGVTGFKKGVDCLRTSQRIANSVILAFSDSAISPDLRSYAGYQLVWQDEFNGNALDTSSWSFQNGDGCPGNCGWGNNELEYYTDHSKNLTVKDGKLVIEANKENFNGHDYTSSKILTRGKRMFKFGRIDIRAQLPKGQGIWPALWLMPQDDKYGRWPKSGEIDMMEMIGKNPETVYGTLHFGPGPNSTQIGKNLKLATGILHDDFHVFSLIWEQDKIQILMDDSIYSTVHKADVGSATYPFNERFFLIINLAVGGGWPGNPDATSTFPQQLLVDYVRVYQKK